MSETRDLFVKLVRSIRWFDYLWAALWLGVLLALLSFTVGSYAEFEPKAGRIGIILTVVVLAAGPLIRMGLGRRSARSRGKASAA